jgi:hypothetical protein
MYLGYYGWKGTQEDISDVIKPLKEDRNVNVEEMIYFVRNYAGWLNAEFRVGGDLGLLKKFLAAGIPVVIEESFNFVEDYWPNDDGWAAHYFSSRVMMTAVDLSSRQLLGPDQKWHTDLDRKRRSSTGVIWFTCPAAGHRPVHLGLDWDVTLTASTPGKLQADLPTCRTYAWFNISSTRCTSINTLCRGCLPAGHHTGPAAAYAALPVWTLLRLFPPSAEDLSARQIALQRTPNSTALFWRLALYRWAKR